MVGLTGTAMEESNPERFAGSIRTLYQGIESYGMMREIIRTSDEYTDDQKIEKLLQLSQNEISAKKECGEILQGNREHTAGVITGVFEDFMECGVRFAPELITKLREASASKAPALNLHKIILSTLPVLGKD